MSVPQQTEHAIKCFNCSKGDLYAIQINSKVFKDKDRLLGKVMESPSMRSF